MSDKLKPNFVESLISKIEDKYIEFKINDEVKFKIKTQPDFGEYMYIINRVSSIINNLSENELRIEIKKITFYAILLDTISDFPVPKIRENETEIYNYDKLNLQLNRIDFETQLFSSGVIFNSMIKELQKAIDDKIEFHKERIIHNSELIKNIFTSFKSIPDMINTFGNSLNGIKQEDIYTLISTFSDLNKNGFNLNEFSDSIVTSFLNKKENNNDIDESILRGAEKEFSNIINLNEEIVDNSVDNVDKE